MALLAFACAQCGLMALPASDRPGRRAEGSKPVASASDRLGPVAGLTSPPDGPTWAVLRLAWLPLCAVPLIALVALARPRERRLRSPEP